MVRRIQTNSIESNLKNISTDAELIREMQGQVALLKREHAREFGRYRAGEMTRNTFLRLKRINAAKIDRMNRKIGRLVIRSRTNLGRISRMIVMHRATTRRKATRRKATRRKVKRKVTKRRKTARKRVTRKRTTRRRVTRKRATRRKTTRRRTTHRRTTRRRRR